MNELVELLLPKLTTGLLRIRPNGANLDVGKACSRDRE
jgi:hypothetical protein